MLPNCAEYVFLWLGLVKLGALPVGVNAEYKSAGLVHLLRTSGARVMVLHAAYVDRLAAIADQLSSLGTVIVLGAPAADVPRLAGIDVLDADELLEQEPPLSAEDVGPGEPLMAVFTSGTTGPPKAIEVSHGFALQFVRERIEHLGLDERDVFYSPYPFSYADTPICTLLVAMALGAKAVLGTKFSARTFWGEIRAHGVTSFMLIGALAEILLKAPPKSDDANNPARIAVVVPALSSASAFEERFGMRLVELYGATECGEVAWTPLDEPRRPGSSGRVCDHHEVRILGDDDVEQPPGVVGEIVVRPRVPHGFMDGYLDNQDATREVCRNLWYRTGDLGYVDADNWLYFVERRTDSLRVRGRNIASYEIETIMCNHPAIAGVGVVGVPSELSEDDIKLVIVPTAPGALRVDDVLEFSREHLARYMVPRYVEFKAELPLTSNGKVNKAVLRADWRTASTYDVESRTYLRDDEPTRAHT